MKILCRRDRKAREIDGWRHLQIRCDRAREIEIPVDHVGGSIDRRPPVGEDERGALADGIAVEAPPLARTAEPTDHRGLHQALEIDRSLAVREVAKPRSRSLDGPSTG